jgi:hypothetical protein
MLSQLRTGFHKIEIDSNSLSARGAQQTLTSLRNHYMGNIEMLQRNKPHFLVERVVLNALPAEADGRRLILILAFGEWASS